MSENKKEFMLIVAGYKDEVENCFFSVNQGLRRRFMWYHTIEKYTPEELFEIFKRKIEKSKWNIDPECDLKSVKALFNEYKEKFNEGSAGDVENFFTHCKVKHSSRIFGKDPSLKKVLTFEDIDASVRDFKKEEQKKKNDPPPMMYL
jgi:replication-associated recombination protein RarA